MRIKNKMILSLMKVKFLKKLNVQQKENIKSIYIINYIRLNNLIEDIIEENGNISGLSISKGDGSVSLISNQEIWKENKYDSQNFFENFEKLKKNAYTKIQNKTNGKKKVQNKLEDFDDEDIDEHVTNVKNSQIKQISESSDIRNNLNQLMMKNNNTQIIKNNNANDNNNNNYKNNKNNNINNNLNSNMKNNINNNINNNLNNNMNSNMNNGMFDNTNQNYNKSYNTVNKNSISYVRANSMNNQNMMNKELNMNYMSMMSNMKDMNYPNNYQYMQNLNSQNQQINKNQIPNNQNLNFNYTFPQQIYIQNYQQILNQQNIYKNNRIIPNFNQMNMIKNNNSSNDNKIKIDDIIIGKEKRTTLMLRNIPNKYTLNNVVDEIDRSFWGKYDYINLPIDYERKLNLGYAFINFVDPMHIILFYETYHLKKWSKYKSDKKMDMSYADKQGKKDINCKDDQTYFAIEDKRFVFNSLQPKIEIPVSYLNFFRKIYPNSVCILEDKNDFYNDKCFVVKHLGKK